MATLSSILAWNIPWTKEPGGLQSMGHKKLDITWRLNHHHALGQLFPDFFSIRTPCPCRLFHRTPKCITGKSSSFESSEWIIFTWKFRNGLFQWGLICIQGGVCVVFLVWYSVFKWRESNKSGCSLIPPDVAQFADWRGKAGSLVCRFYCPNLHIKLIWFRVFCWSSLSKLPLFVSLNSGTK